MYGRGVRSIAEQIKHHPGDVTKEDITEAKALSDNFFNNYPGAKKWMEGNYKLAHEQGYVEDLWGRRRRLPDARLPKYTFESLSDSGEFNPLLDTVPHKKEIPQELIDMYTDRLDRARGVPARQTIIQNAEKIDGIKITNNSGFIAQAERQSINAPIQGGSATMTKLAMRNLYNNPELNELDYHLLIPVHDELIAEFPLWNADRCMELMSDTMAHAGEPVCEVPMKSDGDLFFRWYGDVASAHVKEDYEKAIESGLSEEEAFNKTYEEYCEFTLDEFKEYLEGKY